MDAEDQQGLESARSRRKSCSEQPPTLKLRVSPKGALSVYGLWKFPVTLYKGQWQRLLADAERLLMFIADHNEELL